MRQVILSGTVVKGFGLATRLGCPTANIVIGSNTVIPSLGVYVAQTEIEGKRFPSLVFVSQGHAGNALKLETHLIGEEPGPLIGKRISVFLLEKRRPVVPYDGEDAMRGRIAKDLADARRYF